MLFGVLVLRYVSVFVLVWVRMYYSSASIVLSENHYGLEAGQKRHAKDNSGDIMFSKQVKDWAVKGDIRGRMVG